MAYDRYDSRRGERGRMSGESLGSDRDYPRRDFGDRDERGFIERAGDEIRSWFGDDEDDRHSFRGDRDEMMRRRHRDRESGGFFGRDRGDDDGFFSDRRVRAPQADRDYRPMTGDYGRARQEFGRDDSQWDRDPYRRSAFAGAPERGGRDPHYDELRRQQMEQLDSDYDEYRREHQSRFESEFGSWRERRQQKRQLLGTIREHMEVVGSDDEHIGTVDRVAGDRIILTKSDPESGGVHHSLSCSDLDRIDGERVILSLKGEEARNRWRDESRERALFEREDQGEAGPRMLDRSFSGTYRR